MKHSRDANHPGIQQAYIDMGCSVFDASKVGSGFPDLVVGIAGTTHLVEIKAPTGKLRKSQADFNDAWRGGKPVIVRSVEDVILHVAACRKWPAAPSRFALDHCS
jgi:hypothetical protein